MKALIKKIRRILKDRRTRRMITRIVSFSAALVVFVTTYALVLPAITMEAEAQCGIEAHQHDDSCYEDVLVCGQEESEGHTHDESCYSISQELICEIPEHQHDETCYDEDGNLQCQMQEHEHTDDCYKEVRELTCTLEESEGHHHTDACYEKNLICGKEVHTHSPDCYEKEAADAVEAFAGYTAGTAYEVDDGSDSGDNSGADGLHAAGYNDGSEGSGDTDGSEGAVGADASAGTDNTDLSAWEPPLLEESAAAATTNVLLPEDLQTEDLSDGYVPQLDSLYFDAVLNDHTAFYYFHPEEGEEIPANSVDITSWKPVDKNTELAPTDLVKAYLAYTIPAGSLNETNQIARYRLPANIHLTDDQIIAINNNENGIAAGYVDPSTNTVLDEDADNYHKYLGAEAVEGTRRPDQDSRNAGEDGFGDTAQEYISATVKAENVFDVEGIYGEKGAYLGQDLIFVFSPYTIEKNQTTYDTAGNPTARGEKVTGWFAVDLNMEQIDWVEEETREEQIGQVTEEPASEQADQIGEEPVSDQTDQSAEETAPDQIDQSTDEVGQSENTNKTINIVRTTIVKSAEIIFAENNKDVKASEISRRLKLVEYTEREEKADAATTSSDEVTEADTAAAAEDAVDETVDEGSVEDQVPDDAADADSTTKEEQASEGVTSDDKDQEAEDKDKEKQEPEYKDGSLTSEGDDYKITLDYTAEAKIPAEAVLSVREITAETDPEVYQACLDQARAHTSTGDSTIDQQASRFFDIEIVVKDEEGQQQKIEPEAPVSVNIQLPEKKDTDKDQARKDNNSKDKGSNSKETKNEDSKGSASQDGGSSAKNAASTQDPTVLHFAEKGVEQVEAETSVNETKKDTATEVQFQAESFSIYGVIYTVDFHWEVDGKTYEYSLAGGDSVSFRELLKLLHVIGTADDAQENGEQENGSWLDKITGLFKNNEEQDAGAEEFDQFINDISSVRFSDESLVKVSPITEETTAGALKDQLDLECEYSAELSDAQRRAMDSKAFYPTDWALISLKAFTTEEYLTVEMKNGEKFQIRVTDAQIKKTVIDAKGDTWEITVTYGEDAQIPDGAELKVREILPEDEEYQDYFHQSLERISLVSAETEEEEADEDTDSKAEHAGEIATHDDSYAHIFDIQIWADGQEIQPASDVSVSIKLLDAPEEDNTDLKIVHFGKDGLEVMELAENDEAKSGKTELSFVTDEFSVYTVVDARNTNLNGQSFALVSGIANDPGATTGYWESDWNATDYFTIIVNASAVSNGTNNNGITSTGVHVWAENGTSYAGGEVPEWTFESAGNGKYYLFVIDKNGNRRYLSRPTQQNQYTWDASLVNDRNSATALTVTSNGDGTVLIYDDRNNQYTSDQRYYLFNDGNGEWADRTFKFKNKDNNNAVNTSSSAVRFKLCKKSDDFDSCAAKKVSAADLTADNNFLIYRKFVDEKGNEQLYALASDGTFVRVYDGGDSVYWRETDKNIYWNYLMDGNNYSIFSTKKNSATGQPETVFLNPVDSTGQTLAGTATKLRLAGKNAGKYGSTIENWDQTAYDYAGLHVTLNSQGIPVLSSGTVKAGTSDEFLFAVASSMPAASKDEKVATVDSESLGIHITVFDYGRDDYEYSAGTKLSGMTNVVGTGSAAYTPHEAHALVKPYLVNGLPSGSHGAMTGLFTSNGSEVTYSQSGVTNLFLKSYYDENGMFRYRSEDNYAYLGKGGNTDFTVYRHAATPYTTDTKPGHSYYYHGHYMPFNDIDVTQHVGRLMNQYGNEYTNGNIVGELPIGDGRTYEEIYGTTGIPNFYTGMMMEASFSQPRNGKLENGDDMIFKFTGDDDMWVYIDGVLVLDVGGIHEPLSGTINFRTGEVTNPTGSSLAGSSNLKTILTNALNTLKAIQNPTNEQKEQIKKLESIKWNGNTFADYSNHEFKAFYMERGAGASNLDLQFNLKVVLTKQFTVSKELPDDIDTRYVNQKYKFQATFIDDTDGNKEKPLYKGAKKADGTTVVCDKIFYQGYTTSTGGVDDTHEVEVDENGYFYLKAGETAVFHMTDESIKYNVREVDVDQYHLERITINGEDSEHVDINDDPTLVVENEAEAGEEYVSDRSSLLFTNYPKKQALKITKHILGSAPEDTFPVFEFHVYLETTVIEKSAEPGHEDVEIHKLVPYSQGPYYLTKEVGGQTHYFQLTGTNDKGGKNLPVDVGAEPVICSQTGSSGSINSIPPDYTIVIPNLVIGTHFYLVERLDNLPEGCSYVREKLTEGTYDPMTMDPVLIDKALAHDEVEVADTYDPATIGKIKAGSDAESHIYNRYGISATKEWQDVDGNATDGGNPRWPADVTFKIRKKIVSTNDDEEVISYADVSRPAYYNLAEHSAEAWSDTITVNSPSVQANWLHLDTLPEGQSYVIIEHAITGVAESDIVRDEKSGAVKSFKLNGKIYYVTDSELGEDGGKVINKEQEQTDIEVKKEWGNGQSAPEGAEVVFTLKGAIPGTATEEVPNPEPVVIDLSTVGVTKTMATLNGGVEGGDDTAANPWIYSWMNLPKYDMDGNRITYTAEETSYKIGDTVIDLTSNPPTTGSDSTYELIVTNQLPTTTFGVTKEWVNGNNNIPPAGATITATLYKGASTETATTAVSSIVLNGTADYNENVHVEGEPENENAYEDSAWHAAWKNLPVYNTDGRKNVYVVKESVTYNGYTVSYEKLGGAEKNFALDGEKITNSQSSYSFDILKVAEGTTNTLPGASFTIHKVEPESTTSSVIYVGGTSPSDPEMTGSNGKVSFNDIELGYYEVKETKTPDGYVITGDAAFYVKIEAKGIKLLEKEVKDGKLSFKEATSTKVGNVTIGTQGTTVTFTVENTPGAALPNTGGPGTRLFYLLGILLAGIAGAGLLLRKHRSPG